MKATLSPEQYQKLKQIRAQAIKDATQAPILRLTDRHRSVAEVSKIVSLIALSRNVQLLTHTIAQRTKCDRCKSALDSR